MMPGKRGSRRLVGDHILTQHDLMSATFDDAVAIGGWPMDDHPPEGSTAPICRPTRSCARRRCTTFRCARSTAGTSRIC